MKNRAQRAQEQNQAWASPSGTTCLIGKKLINLGLSICSCSLLLLPLVRQNIPDGCIIPCYPQNIKIPTQNCAPSCPMCPTVNGITWLHCCCLFTCPHPSRITPSTPALPSGTLGISNTLPAHPKDPICHPNKPRLHGKYPNLHCFLAGGVCPTYIDHVCWAKP